MTEYIGKDWFDFKGLQDMPDWEETGMRKCRRYELKELDLPLSEIINACYYSYANSVPYDNYFIKQMSIELTPRGSIDPFNAINISFKNEMVNFNYVPKLVKFIDELDLEISWFILWTDTKKVKKPNSRRLISGTTRQNVLMRDNYTCQICGATVKDGAKLEIDHIIPYSKGGTNDENNLQVLCQQCNREKHNRSDLLHDKQKLAELKGV